MLENCLDGVVMVSLLLKRWLKSDADAKDPAVRRSCGAACGAVGIGFNVLLFGIKLIAGLISSSIAVTADAFNNLSDAGSSIITLLGFKLAGQKPDPEHPFGHGRFEYLSGLLVSVLIIVMGVELFKSSVEKIFAPEATEASVLVYVILCVSIAVKLYMFSYNRKYGKKFNSTAMAATAIDSLSDTIATSVVLLSMIVSSLFHVNIDAYCGVAVSLFILYSGFGSAKDTISPLLGQPPAPELVERIYSIVLSYPEIRGTHDLIVNDYGPGRLIISLHAEVSAKADILTIHDVIDNAESRLSGELGCIAVIHMDPVVTDDAFTNELCERITALVGGVDPQLTLHDFRVVPGPTHTNIIFDVVVPHKFPLTDTEIEERLNEGVKTIDENYRLVINFDSAYAL